MFWPKQKANQSFHNEIIIIIEKNKTIRTNFLKNETLKWVHKGISNLKRNLLGIHHMITYKYLQNYLNEFVYKLNRRYFGERLFDRLIVAAVHPYVQ